VVVVSYRQVSPLHIKDQWTFLECIIRVLSQSTYFCSIVSVYLRLIDNVASAVLLSCFVDMNEDYCKVMTHILNYISKES
jgi:hypothetical protein